MSYTTRQYETVCESTGSVGRLMADSAQDAAERYLIDVDTPADTEVVRWPEGDSDTHELYVIPDGAGVYIATA